jgi:peptidoglycan/LPS O-acetylase OafA/YrhL
MNRRYEELDSLRGLAATAVVLSHLAMVLPDFYIFDKFKNTALQIFWEGHSAVILFFVLSGFVLSIPSFGDKKINYKVYLTKRICRIYIPYLISIIITLTLMNQLARTSIPGFDVLWANPITLTTIIDHVVFLGEFNSGQVNNVIWSLVHEMRISLIFPFILYILVKMNWIKSLISALIIPVVIVVVYYVSLITIGYDLLASLIWEPSAYIRTIHFVSFFVLGAILARYLQYFNSVYGRTNKFTKMIIISIAVTFYMYNSLIFPENYVLHLPLIGDWMIAIGCLVFIVFSLNSTLIKRFLSMKPVNFTGKISYSLYLIHMPVICTLINILEGKISLGLICLISFILSYFFATLMYYLIEKPSIHLGRSLTKGSTKVMSSKPVSA